MSELKVHPKTQTSRNFYFSAAAIALLILMALLAGGAALRESVTIDEVAHIGAGVSYLQRLDLRMNEEHPPLPKIWAAIPLVLRGTHADYTHISWTFGDNKFFGTYLGQWVFGAYVLNRWNDQVSTLAWARFPMLLLTLALGWSIFVVARRLGGNLAGLLCLIVYVSSPVFLAFGPLVHTDIPVTLFTLLTLWTFAEVWREPDRKKSFLFGLCLAAAILSKFTAGILFFAFGIFAFGTRWWPVPGQPGNKPEQRIWRRLRWRATLKGIGWAAAFVYLFYFIFSIRQPTASLDFIGHGAVLIPIKRLLMPVWLVLRGLFMVLITASRPTFILGHAYPHGIWFYFPVVFLLKSPVGFLGLLLLAAIVALFSMRNSAVLADDFRVHWRVLWVSLIVFTIVCMLSRLDISIRHFTVPIVLLILLLAPLPGMIASHGGTRPVLTKVAAVLVIILAGGCLHRAVLTYPFYFPYVNQLGMGRPAYQLMNDSNVDWNQSIPEVRNFVEKRDLKRIALDWYGLTESTLNVPGSYEWNCEQPSSADAGQWAVISANLILESRNCVWLLQYPHEPLAGGSMMAFRLPETIPAAGSPGGPPQPSEFHQFFGAPFDIRTMFIGLIRNPESLPEVYAEMGRRFQAEADKRKHSGDNSSAH